VTSTQAQLPQAPGVRSDKLFHIVLGALGGFYVLMIVLMLLADTVYMVESDSGAEGASPLLRPIMPIISALSKPEIRYSLQLSLISCSVTALLSLWVAVPLGYLLSRHRFPGRFLVDAIVDIPIVLPPLVVGLSLLILFQYAPFSWISRSVVYQVPAVILAQFMVSAAFAVRTMRSTFDQIDPRREQVALTLGCTGFQAFAMVALPQAGRGMLTAATLAWARSLGEFGPLLVFAGATRNKTEVLSTTVFLELSIGNIQAAVAVSLLLVFAAVSVLILARALGIRSLLA
jgi:molybdate transport system permease protein